MPPSPADRARRRALGAAALVAVAVLAWWALREGPATAPSPAPREGPSRGSDAPPPVPASSARPAAPPTDAGAAPDPEGPPRVATPSWIEVHVADADGTPLPAGVEAEAYALPAGGRGTDDGDSIPRGRIPGDGPARLAIHVPGRYDVGVLTEMDGALATDVEVAARSTTAVRLRLRPTRRTVFRLSAPRTSARVFDAAIGLEVEGAAGAPRYAGREEVLASAFGIPWSETASPIEIPLPLGPEYHWRVHVQERREDPPGVVGHVKPAERARPARGVLRAGDEVDIVLLAPARLRLRVRMEPPLPPGCSLLLETLVEQDGSGDWEYSDVHAPEVRAVEEATLEVDGLPGAAALRYRRHSAGAAEPGVDFTEGRIEGIVLSAEEPVEHELVLAIDPGPALVGRQMRQPVRLDVRLPGGSPAPTAGLEVYAVEPVARPGDTPGWARYTGFPAEGPVELPARVREGFHRILVAGGPYLASEILPFPALETLRVELRPGGLLRPWWEGPVPDGDAGGIEFRRADGGVLLGGYLMKGGRWELSEIGPPVPWAEDIVLGPLPAGTHVLEVRLGGARLPDATATVVAGETRPLRVALRRE